MHGFVGIIDGREKHVQPVVDWMNSWIAAGVPKRSFEVSRDAFRFVGSLETPDAPTPVAEGPDGLLVLFQGYLARDQFADQQHPEPDSDRAVAEALMRLYRRRGADALAALNGRYVAAAWNPAERRLELATDALGFFPVFVWSRQGIALFASNVWAIVSHPRFQKKVDARGLVELLMLSHQQGNRTLFEGVSLLPPGSVTTVIEGKASSRTIRTLQFSQERWDWSIERAAQAMYRVLSKAVSREADRHGTLLLPLSGGFDSRTLLGFLCEHGADIETVTQYQLGLFATDTRYARKLARKANVPHEVVQYDDHFLQAARKKGVAISGGLYDIHTTRHFSWLFGREVCDWPVVSAFMGGELTSRFQISDTAFDTPHEHWELAWQQVNAYRFSPEQVRDLLSSGIPADIVQGSIAENKRPFVSDGGPFFHRFYKWDILGTRRRYISYQLVFFAQMTDVLAPFCDLEFVDFMCSLPFAAIHRQHAYRTMLREHFPDLARVPNTNDLPVLVGTREVLADFLATQYRRFIRQPLRKLVPARRRLGNPKDQYGFALQGESAGVLDHILATADLWDNFLEPSAVRMGVDRQRQGDNSGSIGLLGLSAFATALEMLENPESAYETWNVGQ